jgi:hypothetical protein
MASKTVPWLIFLGFALAWTLFHALSAPNWASTDVYIFRDAGCNCAAGEGLVARSVPHNQSVEPELFASYTPGAPLLFALPARLFGCKPYVDTFYNLFFATLSAALLLYGLLRGVPSGTAWLWSAVLIGGILPTGLLSINGDRPETPAFCLLAALLLMWREDRSASFKVILVGLNGLVFLIHPFAGVVGYLLFCFLLTFTPRQPQAPARRCLIAGAGFIVMFLTIAACAFTMWRLDPASLQRFVVHATTLNAPVQQAFRNLQGTGVDSAGGAAALHANPPNTSEHVGYVTAFRHIFNSGTVLGGVGVISLLVAFVAIGAFVFYSRSPAEAKNKCRLQFLVLALLLLGLPVIFFPAQANYFDLARGCLLLMVVLGGFELSDLLTKSRLPLLLVMLAFLSLTPSLAVTVFENIETRASYKHAVGQAQRTADYFARKGIQDPAILVSVSEYFLYKPHFNRLYAPNYLVYPGGRKDYDGLVLCYTTTLAFTHADLPWPEGLSRDGWQLIENGQDSLRISLLGKPVMRRNWTWSCDVYASTAVANAKPGDQRRRLTGIGPR